jgi:hypothetical protein
MTSIRNINDEVYINGTGTFLGDVNLSTQNPSRVLVTDPLKNIISSSTTDTTFNNIFGLTSNLQNQLNNELIAYNNNNGTQYTAPILLSGSYFIPSSQTGNIQIAFPAGLFSTVPFVVALPVEFNNTNNVDGVCTINIQSVSANNFVFQCRAYSNFSNNFNNNIPIYWIAIGNNS